MFNEITDIINDLQAMGALSRTSATLIAIAVFALIGILFLLLLFLLWKCAQKLNKYIFKKLEIKRGRSLYTQFLERVFAFAITIAFIVIPFNFDRLRQSLFGSAALITAIVGFAAQDIIKDILSGLQISLYRPFDIGDRIELEDGTAGIVESITMRHVVIRRIDTIRTVIPNSKLNGYSILNYSYNDIPRSILLKYPVSYDSDIEKARQTIRQAIAGSPHTIPGKRLPDGTMEYAPVYFFELSGSALIMSATVYYQSNDSTEVVRDSVNTRVFEALAANGIEIPYAYTNVILHEKDRDHQTQTDPAGT